MNNIMRFVLTAQAFLVMLRLGRPAAQTLGRYLLLPSTKLSVYYLFSFLLDKNASLAYFMVSMERHQWSF